MGKSTHFTFSAQLNFPKFNKGWVWLVGAGPGDVGLLTLHAIYALQNADVIVYDALVNDTILTLAHPDAHLIYAGKRGGKPSPLQQDITAQVIAHARDSKRVLRLKGGDPFIFGRGGEEALALKSAAIPFRVVPGITAGIGGLAYAGIPATHRETNYTLTFVTGHASNGKVPDTLHWQGLVAGSQVLIFYMGLRHITHIQYNLLQHGKPSHTPCAIVCNATTAKMQTLTCTLSTVVETAKYAQSPSVIVVGDVVHLRQHLNWLGI